MAKIDTTVVRETKYIALWVVILSAIMESVFLIMGMWDYRVLLGNLFGGAVAVLNFFLMGMTIQNAVMKEEKGAAMTMKVSQTMRNFLLIAAALLGIIIPFFNGAATIIPLFFPRIAIAFIPFRSKKKDDEEVNING